VKKWESNGRRVFRPFPNPSRIPYSRGQRDIEPKGALSILLVSRFAAMLAEASALWGAFSLRIFILQLLFLISGVTTTLGNQVAYYNGAGGTTTCELLTWF